MQSQDPMDNIRSAIDHADKNPSKVVSYSWYLVLVSMQAVTVKRRTYILEVYSLGRHKAKRYVRTPKRTKKRGVFLILRFGDIVERACALLHWAASRGQEADGQDSDKFSPPSQPLVLGPSLPPSTASDPRRNPLDAAVPSQLSMETGPVLGEMVSEGMDAGSMLIDVQMATIYTQQQQ